MGDSKQLIRYKVTYSPDILDPKKIEESLMDLYGGTQIHVHNTKRNYVAVTLPKNKADELQNLEGIVGVFEDNQFDLDC